MFIPTIIVIVIGWEGTTCHLPRQQPCTSSPCLHGGTCINQGDSYSCTCRHGYSGERCQHDATDCSSHPCYNGGRCIAGANWFLCECAPGFTGPDCRININECASNPCGHGGTCMDEIGDFKCVCPAGRSGHQCEIVDYLPDSCEYDGQVHQSNTTWQHDCNTCTCSLGTVRCTRVWCGLNNCLARSASQGTVTCGSGQVCVPAARETCITSPCTPWGECRDLEGGRRVGPPLFPAPQSCWPNQAVLSNSCARLTLLLDRAKLLTGVSVHGLCTSLRKLLAQHQAINSLQNRLVLLCDLKAQYNDTIEVTLVSNYSILI